MRSWLTGFCGFAGFAVLAAAALPASALRVTQVTPQGEVAEVRQLRLRFDSPVTAGGDPRAAAPATVQCNGATPPGSGRWLNDREWAYDLNDPLAAGQRCAVELLPAMAVEGARRFAFSTGAPVVLHVLPYTAQPVEEEQQFLFTLNGAVDAASVARSAWCEVEGLAERIPVRVLEGAARASLLKALRSELHRGHHLVLGCQRPFAPKARVRVVWGPGVTSAGNPALVSARTQRWGWQVRERFAAEFSCERESARAACLPLRPLSLRFNTPVPREQALAVRLVPEAGAPGAAIAPQPDAEEAGPTLTQLRFAAPLPENTRYTITLPAGLRDETGRLLANAASFPLAVATGALPPLAKFAGAPFGIVEAGSSPDEPALLPLTLRHVQADLQGASTGGQVRVRRFGPETPDTTLLQWLARLQKDHDDQYRTREQPLLARDPEARRAALPQLAGSTPRATEVIGLPLPGRGYHVVEVASQVLGHALLAQRAPMHARTGVLVTNLAVHFKRGRSSSLVWVTALDRARPVPGARVAVNDCHGRTLWSGSTGADGTAAIPRGFEDDGDDRCPQRDGLFVTARSADGSDLGFVFSRWQRGIENWRFNIGTASGLLPDRHAHTVFDRTLLRVGETVSMKHFVRDETAAGLALPEPATLPSEVVITHLGSDTAYRLPLSWPRGPRASESRWVIPTTAPLGTYEVTLVSTGEGGERRLNAGSLRVEAFRVPLVDARLAGPGGVLVAPAQLNLDAQLNAMAGGPMPGTALQLSALLRPASPGFAGHPDFSFEPPGTVVADTEEEPTTDNSRLVAQNLPATTGAQGTARFTLARLPAVTEPSELLAELSFTDPNGEVQTVSQRLRLWPSAVVVGLRVPQWAAVRGELGFTALVVDTAGRPLKGRAVSVSARQHQVLSTRKRLVGGFYAYDNQRQTRELGPVCSGRTDAQGRLACSATLQASGEVELIARAEDDQGRASTAAASAWISSGERWWFAQDNDDRIDLLPERREVEPGQTARLQLRMPFDQATVLVTVEREGLLDARVLTLSGREPVIELPIPRAAPGQVSGWAPNVVVTALALRGRLREAPWWSFFTWGWRQPGQWWQAFRYEGREYRAPTPLVDLAKPTFKLGVAQLQVGLAEHRLEVKVSTPAATYKTRETVRATVSVRQGGQPLAGAEVAFAAVDEGLLALQPNTSWQLLDGLLQPRPWGVETATAQGEVIGRRHYGRKALPPGGGGGRNPTRELFDTLLLWRGTVVLDAQGQATVEVPLNDSLTRFRLVAVADAGAQRFGTGSTTVTVSQDLQLASGLPPLVRSGDRLDATVTLRNGSPRAMTLSATLAGRADGVALPALPAQTVTLAAGAAQELRWPVAVPVGATRLEWEAAATEAGVKAPASDRLRVAQAVLPAVPPRVLQATLVPLDGTLTLPLAPAVDALPGSARVQLNLQPSLTGALPGLRRWFEAYPYTCLEQQTSRAIGLRDAAAWARLQGEAAGYLDDDGLAAYFPPTPGSRYAGYDRLTAYLLAAAHEAGWSWPAPVAARMLDGLAAFVDGRIERRHWSPRADLDARKLAALEALARHGRVTPRQLDSISWAPGAWPTSAVLDALGLYRRVATLPEREARLAELQRLLRSRLVAGGTTLKFSTEDSDDWWWLMDGPDANAARLVLAAAELPGWRDDLPQLVNGALARQRRGAWLTTTANLWGVLALERFAKQQEAVAVAGTTRATLGAASALHDWAREPGGAGYSLPLPAATQGPTPLQLQHTGSGRPWLTVQSLAQVLLAQPLWAGYRITRTVTPLQRRDPQRWSRGDTLRVRLELQAAADMSWVVVADPVPAGATLLGSGLGRDSAIATRGEQREGHAWPAYEERAAEAWRGYYAHLPRGRHVVEYTLRLNASGRFALPPTRVEAMYAPETFGELPNAALEVQP